jgi:hypothetical protein
MQVQCVCHDTLPWLISFSLDAKPCVPSIEVAADLYRYSRSRGIRVDHCPRSFANRYPVTGFSLCCCRLRYSTRWLRSSSDRHRRDLEASHVCGRPHSWRSRFRAGTWYQSTTGRFHSILRATMVVEERSLAGICYFGGVSGPGCLRGHHPFRSEGFMCCHAKHLTRRCSQPLAAPMYSFQ